MRWVALAGLLIATPLMADADVICRPCRAPMSSSAVKKTRREAQRAWRLAEWLFRSWKPPNTADFRTFKHDYAEHALRLRAYETVIRSGDPDLRLAALARQFEIVVRFEAVSRTIWKMDPPIDPGIPEPEAYARFMSEGDCLLSCVSASSVWNQRLDAVSREIRARFGNNGSCDFSSSPDEDTATAASANTTTRAGPQDRSPPPSGEGWVGEKANGAAGSP